MKGPPHSSPSPPARAHPIRPWDLPGVRDLQKAPAAQPQLGLDWATVVFCTFAAPPALVLAGLLHESGSPVAHWLAACGFFFTGLALSLRLQPLPPRRIFATEPWAEAGPHIEEGIELRPIPTDLELECGLPGVVAGMSRPELLEQLAKLREQGDLSNTEYEQALHHLLGE